MQFFILFLFFYLINKKILKRDQIIKIFLSSVILQAIIATIQFLTQHSVGLYLLGEPHLNSEIANIARTNIFSFTVIRPYGTFSHPNILSFFLVTSIFLSFLLKDKKIYIFPYLLFVLLLTLSRVNITVFLLTFLSLLFTRSFKFKKSYLLVFLAIMIPSLFILMKRFHEIFFDFSFQERLIGIKNAVKLFFTNPYGVGINQSTLFLDNVSEISLLPWQYQPVHNLSLLLMSETGILGIFSAIFILGIIIKKIKNIPKNNEKIIFYLLLIFLLITAQFDHFLLSLSQGRYIIILLFGLIFLSQPKTANTYYKNPVVQ